MKPLRILGWVAATIMILAATTVGCWLAFSWATGATLITFRTGSMSPTMPQGSAAISLPVLADDIHVGDVITVQREPGQLPITHRVTEIGAVNATGSSAAAESARQIVMQGDANDSPDMLPYVVTEARKAVFAVPHLGNGIMLAQSPLGMGFATLLTGALVVWAFWPRRETTEPLEEETTEDVIFTHHTPPLPLTGMAARHAQVDSP